MFWWATFFCSTNSKPSIDARNILLLLHSVCMPNRFKYRMFLLLDCLSIKAQEVSIPCYLKPVRREKIDFLPFLSVLFWSKCNDIVWSTKLSLLSPLSDGININKCLKSKVNLCRGHQPGLTLWKNNNFLFFHSLRHKCFICQSKWRLSPGDVCTKDSYLKECWHYDGLAG